MNDRRQSVVPLLPLRRSKGGMVDTGPTRPESVLLKAIEKALHWQSLLETGALGSHREIAQREEAGSGA